MALLFFLCAAFVTLEHISAYGLNYKSEVQFQWTTLDYDWPNDDIKNAYVSSKKFIVENNIISGIKVYHGQVFVTVPRWRSGVPSTLNTVVKKSDGSAILRPFPSWDMQTVGNCSCLQYVQSMEVDPNTGYMWIIDVGRVDINEAHPRNLCPAKLVVYDMIGKAVVHKYEFPDSVVSRTSNFLNDIVLDYVGGHVAFAYMSDTSDSRLIVYNCKVGTSYFFHHSSMDSEPDAENITIGNNTLHTKAKINGIAMSPDFRYLYYNALAAFNMHRISTSVLRNNNSIFQPQNVGRKISQTGGMVFGQRHLFYGALTSNAVIQTTFSADRSRIVYQLPVTSGGEEMRWIDTFAFDQEENLWFTVNHLDDFFSGRMKFDNPSVPNMYIWKLEFLEQGYLWNAAYRRRRPKTTNRRRWPNITNRRRRPKTTYRKRRRNGVFRKRYWRTHFG